MRSAWALTLATIPLLSIYGRTWQRTLSEQLAAAHLAQFISLSLLLLLFTAMVWLIRRGGVKVLWHLLWSLPLFIWMPLDMPVIAERIHFLVFGLFGFLSVLSFGPILGLFLPLLFSGLDELLQWILPDRIGDLRDVSINMLASLGGAMLALTGLRK